jgi:lipopolysaccharide transport system ATP-binding protein
LGAGFNPDFSGIENVYLNAALLGLSRAEVDAKLDDILAFADIGAFVHQPVKTYSSGMFVRLAFAVATSLDPEILVIDEALSVGDGAFARKSFDRVMQMRERGAAVLFCSHSMYHIQALCDRALWLDGGKVRLYDAAAQVTSAYETALVAESLPAHHAAGSDLLQPHLTTSATSDEQLQTQAPNANQTETTHTTSEETGRIVAIEAWTDDGQQGRELAIHSQTTSLFVRVRFASNPELPAPRVGFGLGHISGITLSSGLCQPNLVRDVQGRGEVTLHFPKLPLLQGDYFLTLILGCERGLHVYDMAERMVLLRVNQSGLEKGWMLVPHEWNSESAS